MSAPTLWEEGRWSGDRVTRLAVLLCVALIALSLLTTGEIGLIFEIGFVVICVFTALAVRPRDFFRIGVLPPLLLIGCAVLVSLVSRDSVVSGVGFWQGLMSALADNATALLVGYLLALGVLAIRHQVIAGRTAAAHRPLALEAAHGHDHSNLAGSPVPTRTTSGEPEEKSITVVGDEPASPESTTASSQ